MIAVYIIISVSTISISIVSILPITLSLRVIWIGMEISPGQILAIWALVVSEERPLRRVLVRGRYWFWGPFSLLLLDLYPIQYDYI